MEEVDKRLRETSDICIKAYDAWKDNRKNGEAREALQESVHELRKVASRLEIEVAVSERDEMTQKPIPVPSHRDAQRRGGNNEDRGNRAPKGEGDNNNNNKPKPRQQRRTPKKAASGGEE